jgi:hypothetical protein
VSRPKTTQVTFRGVVSALEWHKDVVGTRGRVEVTFGPGPSDDPRVFRQQMHDMPSSLKMHVNVSAMAEWKAAANRGDEVTVTIAAKEKRK